MFVQLMLHELRPLFFLTLMRGMFPERRMLVKNRHLRRDETEDQDADRDDIEEMTISIQLGK